MRWIIPWLVVLWLGFSAPLRAGEPAVVSILSTDFSRCHDADDWFDVVMFCTDPALRPAGIVLDWHFSSATWEQEEEAIGPLLASLRADGLPLVRGVRGKLRREPDGSVRSPNSDAGARFILDTMRAAPGKVRLISVGSLKNEPLAFGMRWRRGRCSYDPKRLTQFTDDPAGPDEMFVAADNAAIADWVLDRLKHLPPPR